MFETLRKASAKSAFVICLPVFATACAPSLSYRSGQGFYSEQFSQQEVETAASSGKVQNLGRFETVQGACFNYTQDHNDQNIVMPVVQKELQGRGGNAADQVTAKEELYDFGLGFVVVPELLGCSYW